MFLIAACTTLCVCCSVFLLLRTLVDEEHRIRVDRISNTPLWPARALQSTKIFVAKIVDAVIAQVTRLGRPNYERLQLLH